MNAHAGSRSTHGEPVKGNGTAVNATTATMELPGGSMNAHRTARNATGPLVKTHGRAVNLHRVPMKGPAGTVSAHGADMDGNAGAVSLPRSDMEADAGAVGLHGIPDRRHSAVRQNDVALRRSRGGPGGARKLHWNRTGHAPDEGYEGLGTGFAAGTAESRARGGQRQALGL